jgi:hypothetical protein
VSHRSHTHRRHGNIIISDQAHQLRAIKCGSLYLYLTRILSRLGSRVWAGQRQGELGGDNGEGCCGEKLGR